MPQTFPLEVSESTLVCLAAMALDSRASFTQRALDVGLTEGQIQALDGVGVDSFAKYAYCTAYRPGQVDDTPLVNFLIRAFGANPAAGALASARRLFFESHALALDEFRSRAERTESSEARTVPLAEKMDRVRQLKARLTGLTFTPATEPSHSLIDRTCQQLEDNVLSYIPLNKCTSRQDETLQAKTDSAISMDSSGNLRVTKKQKTEDTKIEGEHRLRLAFHRRALAYDIAKIGTFQTMDKWTQTLFDKITEPAVSGFKSVSVDQAINADKALWVKLSEETRANLATTQGQPKPFDVAFERLTNHAEVLLHLTPLPAHSSRSEPSGSYHTQQSFVQQPHMGKGKGSPNKGKGKGQPQGQPIIVPDNCELHVGDKTLCKRCNVGRCKAKIKPGKRCQIGWHLCWRKDCHKAHPGCECPL